MQLSNFFKNMDEVRSYVEQFKNSPPEQYQALLYAFGLAEQEGEYDIVVIDGEEKKIDKFIAPIIADLNFRGYHTLACCSGLAREHKGPGAHAYLSIAYKDGLVERLKSMISAPEIRIEETECYLKRAIRISIKNEIDSLLEEKWTYLWDALAEIKKSE